MRVVVHSAAIQDRDWAGLVPDKIRRRFPWLDLVWADGGCNGWQVEAVVAKVPLLHMEIVRRSDDMRASSLCRAAGWSSVPPPGSRENRRLAKDSETLPKPSRFRDPRLHPAGPQAACQGVDRELNKPLVCNAR